MLYIKIICAIIVIMKQNRTKEMDAIEIEVERDMDFAVNMPIIF